MNGVTVGAVNDARAAYDIHNSNSNQENQGPSKSTSASVQQRPSNSVRTPLSTLPAGRVESNDYGQVPQQRSQDRMGDMEPLKSKGKTELEVENHHPPSKRKSSNGNLSTAESDDIPENMYRPEKEDAEGWIHREKLAKIESEELQAAGINLAKARSRSRDALGDRLRTASRDRLRSDFVTGDGNTKEDKRRKVSSPIPMTGPVQQAEDEETVERMNWDLRTPEEIAEAVNSQTYTTPVLRKSGSKIPVLSPGGTPITQDRSDTETSPMARKRTMSGSAVNDDELHSHKTRPSGSKWNEEIDTSISGTSRKTSSPTKTRQKSISGGPGMPPSQKAAIPRKTSTTKPNPTTPNGRPKTRGNDTERPKTAVNPPEGDPPWLADMYKPDPRLPPDQQLIPTLAKKRQQMQWEENGMVPKTYDREFAALAVHENDKPRDVQPVEDELPIEKDDTESWPLKPMASTHNTKEGGPKPITTNAPVTTGSYSTMPKISSPPMTMTSPKVGSSTNVPLNAPSPGMGPIRQPDVNQQQTTNPQRLQTNEEDEKVQKQGCGCCVIM